MAITLVFIVLKSSLMPDAAQAFRKGQPEMRIAMLLPTLSLRGAVRRSLNLAMELKLRGHELAVVHPGGPMERAFNRLGVPILHWRKPFGAAYRMLSQGARDLVRGLRDFDPDILHVSALGEVEPWRHLTQRVNASVVATVYSAEEARAIDRSAWSQISGVIAVSHDTRQALVNDAKIARDKIRIVLPGASALPEDLLIAALGRMRSHSRPVVACYGPVNWVHTSGHVTLRMHEGTTRVRSGRFEPLIGGEARSLDRAGRVTEGAAEQDVPVRILLRAARKLRERGYDFQVLIIGDGDATSYIREWIDLNDAGSWAVMINELYDHRKLYSYADIAVAVSDSHDATQFTLEAMGQGVPAVLSAKGGNYELIDDERSGLLYPPDDPDALAHRLERLIVDASFREALATEGVNAVRKRLNLERMGDETEELYRLCLRQSGREEVGDRHIVPGLKKLDVRESTLSSLIPHSDKSEGSEEESDGKHD